MKHGPTHDGEFLFEYAAVLLLSGDRSSYVRACARMVERSPKVSNLRAYQAARACTLAPDAVADATLPDRADETLGLHLHNWLEAHVLRREAEALIQPAEKR